MKMAVIKLFTVFVLITLVVDTFAATVFELHKDQKTAFDRVRRASDPECYSTTPCGWAVYARYTRKLNYFMRNNCECPTNKRCVRAEDDLSVSAYVYRCKVDETGGNNNLES